MARDVLAFTWVCNSFTGSLFPWPAVAGLRAVNATTGGGLLTVALNPQKTHSQLAVLSPYWAFCFKGGKPGKNPKIEMNSEL